MKYIYISLLLIILTLGIACNRSDHDTLEVYAASSLSDVLNELIEEYEKISPHDISISYAGSSTLRQQIQYGATPNIFISADEIQFVKTQELNLLDRTTYELAENKLAIITNKKHISTLQDIIQNDISIAVGMREVPIGNYTNQLLLNINEENIYGNNYSDLFNINVVSKERNVKMVASKVLLKEIDVAVVYETDYISIDNNQIYKINIPTNINILTSIYAGIVKESSNRNLSKEFLNYISSEKVKHIWIKHGFIITD